MLTCEFERVTLDANLNNIEVDETDSTSNLMIELPRDTIAISIVMVFIKD